MLGGVVSKSTEGSKVTDATLASETTAALSAAASSVDTTTAASAMDIVNALPATEELALVLQQMAKALLSSVAVGDTFQATSGSNTISASKVTGSSLAGSQSSTGTSSITMSGLPVDSESAVGISGAVSSDNAYAKAGRANPSTGTTSYNVTVDGADFAVSGLVNPILITMDSTDGDKAICRYFDEDTEEWSTAGTYLYSSTATTITCATTHLTTFAGFSSSSSAGSTIVASVAALVAIVVAQLLTQ